MERKYGWQDHIDEIEEAGGCRHLKALGILNDAIMEASVEELGAMDAAIEEHANGLHEEVETWLTKCGKKGITR